MSKSDKVFYIFYIPWALFCCIIIVAVIINFFMLYGTSPSLNNWINNYSKIEPGKCYYAKPKNPFEDKIPPERFVCITSKKENYYQGDSYWLQSDGKYFKMSSISGKRDGMAFFDLNSEMPDIEVRLTNELN